MLLYNKQGLEIFNLQKHFISIIKVSKFLILIHDQIGLSRSFNESIDLVHKTVLNGLV